jgi:hypothetical protein
LSRFRYDPSPYLCRIWKNYPRSYKADYTRADGIAGYARIARYTLEFLEGYLKHDAQAMAFLKMTAEVGVPPPTKTAVYTN